MNFNETVFIYYDQSYLIYINIIEFPNEEIFKLSVLICKDAPRVKILVIKKDNYDKNTP